MQQSVADALAIPMIKIIRGSALRCLEKKHLLLSLFRLGGFVSPG